MRDGISTAISNSFFFVGALLRSTVWDKISNNQQNSTLFLNSQNSHAHNSK